MATDMVDITSNGAMWYYLKGNVFQNGKNSSQEYNDWIVP